MPPYFSPLIKFEFVSADDGIKPVQGMAYVICLWTAGEGGNVGRFMHQTRVHQVIPFALCGVDCSEPHGS